MGLSPRPARLALLAPRPSPTKTLAILDRSILHTLNVLDLFAGAGGLTQGFSEASERFETVRAVEMDGAAAATYEANHGVGLVKVGSIQDWLATTEPDTLDVDVVVGGPPCQGFSQLGKQEVDDERNLLWERYAETIVRTRPDYFVVENVATFLKSPQFEDFQRATEPKGQLHEWTFQARVLNAADYGAPQTRKRAVLIGHRRDLPFPGWPATTTAPQDYVSVDGAFRAGPGRAAIPLNPRPGLPARSKDSGFLGPFTSVEMHVMRSYREVSVRRFARIPKGGNRFDLPDDLKAPCWRTHTTGSGDVMGRLWGDRPSVTIRTEFFKPEKGRYLHPTENRAITHWEAARLQGFPDNYKWYGSKTAIARQIGNAVPIPLGKAIALQLLKAADLARAAEHADTGA